MERTFLLHSSHRSAAETPGNFSSHTTNHLESYTLKRTIVKNVGFMNSIPNVANVRLYFRTATASYEVIVPDGQYTVDDFLAELPASVTLATAGAIELTSATVDARGIVSLTFSAPVYVLSVEEVQRTKKDPRSVNKMLGCNFFTPETFNAEWVLPNTCNFRGPTELHLHSQALGRGNAFESSGDVSSVLCVIPVSAAYGEYQSWEPSDVLLSYVDSPPGQSTSLPSKIDISLRLPEDDSVAAFAANSDVSVALLFVFES